MLQTFQCRSGHRWEAAIAVNAIDTFCTVSCPECGAVGIAQEGAGPSGETLPSPPLAPASGASVPGPSEDAPPTLDGSPQPGAGPAAATGAAEAPPTLADGGAAEARVPAQTNPGARAPPPLSLAGADRRADHAGPATSPEQPFPTWTQATAPQRQQPKAPTASVPSNPAGIHD